MADSKKYNGSQWEHSLRKLTTATEAVENPLYSDGTAITAYTIKGNTVQDGTPTPDNPVEVNGVGVRTENLWNEDYTGISDTPIYKPVYVGDGNFTLSTTAPQSSDPAALLFLLSGNVRSGASSNTDGVWNGQNRTKAAVDGYVTVAYRALSSSTPVGSQTMLNTGSTAKPYEPYGYKIPISNGQQTTNIYLGSTQTVRQIKKLVFTGNEQFTNEQIADGYRAEIKLQDYIKADAKSLILCSHFPYRANWTIVPGFVPNNAANRLFFMSLYSDFAAYCAQQYANGTPVTVYYVLTTPQTAAVNEPLMKIGNYADTLSNATAIPTTEGANSITVDTTVQPSEFTATWTGWHNANVKEWDGSQWD